MKWDQVDIKSSVAGLQHLLLYIVAVVSGFGALSEHVFYYRGCQVRCFKTFLTFVVCFLIFCAFVWKGQQTASQ